MRLTEFTRNRFNDGMRIIRSFSLADKEYSSSISINQMTQNNISQVFPQKAKHTYLEKLSKLLQDELLSVVPGSYALFQHRDAIMHTHWLLSNFSGLPFASAETTGCLYEICGEYYLRTGNLAAAQQYLKKAADSDACSEAVRLSASLALASLYETERDYPSAQQILDSIEPSAVMLKTSFPIRYFHLKLTEAYLYEDLEMATKTEQSAKEAATQLEYIKKGGLSEEEISEYQMELDNIKGHILYQKGDYTAAKKQYQGITESALTKVPAYAHAQVNLGRLQIELSESNEDTLTSLKDAAALLAELYGKTSHPDIAFAANGLGWYYSSCNGQESAEEAARQLCKSLDIVLNQLKLKNHVLISLNCALLAKLHWQMAENAAADEEKKEHYKKAHQYCNQGLTAAKHSMIPSERTGLIPALLYYKINILCYLGRFCEISQNSQEIRQLLSEIKTPENRSMRRSICVMLLYAKLKCICKKLKEEKHEN